jgi:ribosomal protein S18 acetylase RimI-like enzyme
VFVIRYLFDQELSIEIMNEIDRLLAIYRQRPCRTMPNAFWKTRVDMLPSEVVINEDSDGKLESLALWREQQLMALWFADPCNNPLTPQQINELRFALVHDTCLSTFDHQNFSEMKAFFRLVHRGGLLEDYVPEGFTVVVVDPSREVPHVASMIRDCYPDMVINDVIVRGWMAHPVYDPRLWVWIKDIRTDRYAALGIAEVDHQVPEASLEWVQVHPDYQKRGLGKTIVSELIRRIHNEVDFITVSGEVDNPSQPERLYRRCGFEGKDIWWLLKV